MADSRGIEEGNQPLGSQTQAAGNATLARGAAGSETGARQNPVDSHNTDIEQHRETEQVITPTSDGLGEGLVKDQS